MIVAQVMRIANIKRMDPVLKNTFVNPVGIKVEHAFNTFLGMLEFSFSSSDPCNSWK